MSATYPSATVFLNVYDIVPHNAILYPWGIGIHHTGIEVYGFEFGFGRCREGTGVFDCEPKRCSGHSFREQLVLGVTPYSEVQVEQWMLQVQRSSISRSSAPSQGPRTQESQQSSTVAGAASSDDDCDDEPTGARSSSSGNGARTRGSGGEPRCPLTRWSGRRYHLLHNNCNHFCEFLANTLLPTSALSRADGGSGAARGDGIVGVYATGEEVLRAGDITADMAIPAQGASPPIDGASGEARGNVVAVRRLIPRWVNRLADIGAAWLPATAVDAIEAADRAAQGM